MIWLAFLVYGFLTRMDMKASPPLFWINPGIVKWDAICEGCMKNLDAYLTFSSNLRDQTLKKKIRDVCFFCCHMDVSSNRGKTPQMDGENNGKPYEQMDDLGGFPLIFGNTHIPPATPWFFVPSPVFFFDHVNQIWWARLLAAFKRPPAWTGVTEECYMASRQETEMEKNQPRSWGPELFVRCYGFFLADNLQMRFFGGGFCGGGGGWPYNVCIDVS